MLSERSQTQSSHIEWLLLCGTFWRGKSIKTESRVRAVRSSGAGEWEVNGIGHRASYWGYGNVVNLECNDGCTSLWIY